MQELLDKPVPIIFAVCEGVQQLANRTFNLLGIFDRLIIYKLPDGTIADNVTLQVITCWTGGRGAFEQVIKVLDQDGQPFIESRSPFTLTGTARHFIISQIVVPVRERIYTLTLARVGEDELVRQDFTIEVAAFPGTGP